MGNTDTIGFGGSCHWCTEAIFQSLIGVESVQQGWIKSCNSDDDFSEAVIVKFNSQLVSLHTLIEVHLNTHSCTSTHTMRSKYRSAVYTFEKEQVCQAKSAIETFQDDFTDSIITQIIPFQDFKLNIDQYLDYYYNHPDKPFCKTFINPKLKILLSKFSHQVDNTKLKSGSL